MDTTIVNLKAREILDSRGNPTVEVDVKTERGFGRAAVPSGASTGEHEALEMRDGDPNRYNGKGVLKAVASVNEVIARSVQGMDAADQAGIDTKMLGLDDTPNKSNLGANAMLGVSLAACRAAADSLHTPLYEHIGSLAFGKSSETHLLPLPMSNVVNAGKHGGGDLELQEFMIQPIGAESFRQGIRWIAEIYHQLRDVLVSKYGVSMRNVGDEGGFSGPIDRVNDVLDSLLAATENAGYEPGEEVSIALDPAASEFYSDGTYTVEGRPYDSGEVVDFFVDLVDSYPIYSIEDAMSEDDWDGFVELTEKLGGKIQLVGDDLFVTNTERLKRGIDIGACNALLLKVNQIGTLSESIEAAKMCMENSYGVVISHRSGETEDTTIADLAVGLNAGQIKTGAPCRSERNAKYNQLLRIEEELGDRASYADGDFRTGYMGFM
jgi:enolase